MYLLQQFSMGLDLDQMAIIKQELLLLYQFTSHFKDINEMKSQLWLKLSIFMSKLLMFD